MPPYLLYDFVMRKLLMFGHFASTKSGLQVQFQIPGGHASPWVSNQVSASSATSPATHCNAGPIYQGDA